MRTMYRVIPILIVLAGVSFAQKLQAFPAVEKVKSGPWYVATDGDDANPGTFDLPFATIQFAIDAASEVDTVLIADGTYAGGGNRDLACVGKSLLVKSESDNPDNCIIDCGGSESEPHFGFWFQEGGDSVLQGITVTNAYVAEPAFAAIMGGGTLKSNPRGRDFNDRISLVRCDVVENHGHGVRIRSENGGIRVLDQCNISYNQGDGFRSGFSVPQVSNCTFEGNAGVGAFLGYYLMGTPPVENSVFRNNGGDGVTFGQYGEGACRFISCIFEGNTGVGIKAVGYLNLQGCSVAANMAGGLDLPATRDPAYLEINDTEFNENGSFGLSVSGSAAACFITNSEFCFNAGMGISFALSGGNVFSLDQVLISHNGASGLEIITEPGGEFGQVPSLELSTTTIANNAGSGISYSLYEGSKMDLGNIVLYGNTGVSLVQTGGESSQVQLSCSDIFANSGGDWVGDIANQMNDDDNFHEDPQFCEPAANDYQIASSSLCAVENNPACGQSGVLGIGCSEGLLTCYPLQSYDSETGYPNTSFQNGIVTVEGVVYCPPGTYRQTGGGYLQDDTGGINFFRDYIPGYINEGDRLRISGTLWEWQYEQYIGDFIWTVLETGLSVEPLLFTVTELLSSFHHVGSFVQVTGQVVNVTPDSFGLSDGGNQVEVFRTAFTGVSFTEVTEGSTWTVLSPCFNNSGTMRLSPRRQTDLVSQVSGVEELPQTQAFNLFPCHPNPFNPTTTISYEIPAESRVELAIYDVMGRLVKTLRSGELETGGFHDVVWQGKDEKGRAVSSGVYLYRIQAGAFSAARRMVLMK